MPGAGGGVPDMSTMAKMMQGGGGTDMAAMAKMVQGMGLQR